MALKFNVLASEGRARVGEMILPQGKVETPVFMPVGTKATVKGILYDQLASVGCVLSLANAYHLAIRPGKQAMKDAGGIRKFTKSDKSFLTDSGGYQMVSLCSLIEVDEEGVLFTDPYDQNKQIMFTPEESIRVQNEIGADIIMQLDDVISSMSRDKERLTVATHRTTRWLDRCIKAHAKPDTQALFPIVQGSIYPDLRRIALEQIKQRESPGYAIGGLAGGEEKTDFWRTVELCTREGVGLPADKPRYLMGVGHDIDLLVCIALGCDMFDCVYPTRTARFGTLLTDLGTIKIQHAVYQYDFRPIDENCDCVCCATYSRSFLHYGFKKGILVSQLLTIHNLRYMMRFLERIRKAIKEGNYASFVRQFLKQRYIDQDELPPLWLRDSLYAAGIDILDFYPDKSHVVACFA